GGDRRRSRHQRTGARRKLGVGLPRDGKRLRGGALRGGRGRGRARRGPPAGRAISRAGREKERAARPSGTDLAQKVLAGAGGTMAETSSRNAVGGLWNRP